MKSTQYHKTGKKPFLILMALGGAIAAVSAFSAADNAPPKRDDFDSGAQLVDWSQDSEWRKKVAQQGRPADTVKVAPPALGRNKMVPQSKRIERGAPEGKPTPPGSQTQPPVKN